MRRMLQRMLCEFVGFYGDECSEVNSCLTSDQPPLCQQGDCISTGNSTHTCQCRPGWYGDDCSLYNPCSVHPYLNATVNASPVAVIVGGQEIGSEGPHRNNSCSGTLDLNPAHVDDAVISATILMLGDVKSTVLGNSARVGMHKRIR